MSILRLARVPAVTIEPSVSVTQGISLMQQEKVGALFVVELGQLRGVLTERDVMVRVALHRRDPASTRIGDAMTSPAWTLSTDATVADAIGMMVAHRVRHLPIVSQGSVKGMVSLRHMLRERLAEHILELRCPFHKNKEARLPTIRFKKSLPC